MRILFWSELFWPYIGGPEVMAMNLLPALRDRGYDFAVITSQDYLDLPPETEYAGIPIHRLSFRAAVAERDIEGLERTGRQVSIIKKRFSPQLIHLNAIGPSAWFHLRTSNADAAPLLVTMHTHLLADAMGGTLQARILGAAEWIVACSASVRSQLCRLIPEAATRSSVIPNSVEVPDLSPGPLPMDPPRVLCLGRLIPVKGFDLALTAVASVIDRFPDVRLTVAGDGPARPTLERTAMDLGLGAAVDFRGWVSPTEVPALINEATLVLMPSRQREGLPVVAIQAALMSRPLVATRVGGLPELVVDGLTGICVDEEDPEGLANAMVFLLGHPEAAAEMGRAARAHAIERFGWDRHVDAYDALYQRLFRRG